MEKLNEQWEDSKAFLPRLKVYQIHSATLDTGVLENEAVLNRLAFLKNEYNFEIGITTTGANQVEVIKKAVEYHASSAHIPGTPAYISSHIHSQTQGRNLFRRPLTHLL